MDMKKRGLLFIVYIETELILLDFLSKFLCKNCIKPGFSIVFIIIFPSAFYFEEMIKKTSE